jgi:hypothetical protein
VRARESARVRSFFFVPTWSGSHSTGVDDVGGLGHLVHSDREGQALCLGVQPRAIHLSHVHLILSHMHLVLARPRP